MYLHDKWNSALVHGDPDNRVEIVLVFCPDHAFFHLEPVENHPKVFRNLLIFRPATREKRDVQWNVVQISGSRSSALTLNFVPTRVNGKRATIIKRFRNRGVYVYALYGEHEKVRAEEAQHPARLRQDLWQPAVKFWFTADTNKKCHKLVWKHLNGFIF